MHFLITSYWRGALNINDMRYFDDEVTAWKYYDSLHNSDSFKRIYQISKIDPPKLLKKPK